MVYEIKEIGLTEGTSVNIMLFGLREAASAVRFSRYVQNNTGWRESVERSVTICCVVRVSEGVCLTVYSYSETDTVRAGIELASRLKPGDIVAMYGELGSGKTALVRGIAAGLGLSCRVFSPTFTIVNEYIGPLPLFHFDMYRLGSSDELFEIGWEDYLARGGICAVEWSENVEDAFPPETIRVRFSKTGDESREIRISFPDDGEGEA